VRRGGPASGVVRLAREGVAAQEAGRWGGWGRSRVRGGSNTSDPPGLPDPPDLPGQPWFVWLHLFDPHAPYRPPPPFDSRYASQSYYGEVAAVDAALAPLIDDLRVAGKPTLVIATGDHGEALADHGELTQGLFAYESPLRVPLIVAEIGAASFGAPGVRPPAASGRSEPVSAPARHIDILPTILEGVGQSVAAGLPGRSLLMAAERTDPSPRPSYFEAMSAMLNRGWAPLAGVLVDREKYIDLPIAERYDLAADPAGRVNPAREGPRRERTPPPAPAGLPPAVRGFAATMPGQRRAEDAEAAARLRALGYVTGSAAPKARYTDADDPKTLVAVDRAVHDAVDAFTAGRAGDAVPLYQQVIARRP